MYWSRWECHSIPSAIGMATFYSMVIFYLNRPDGKNFNDKNIFSYLKPTLWYMVKVSSTKTAALVDESARVLGTGWMLF